MESASFNLQLFTGAAQWKAPLKLHGKLYVKANGTGKSWKSNVDEWLAIDDASINLDLYSCGGLWRIEFSSVQTNGLAIIDD